MIVVRIEHHDGGYTAPMRELGRIRLDDVSEARDGSEYECHVTTTYADGTSLPLKPFTVSGYRNYAGVWMLVKLVVDTIVGGRT